MNRRGLLKLAGMLPFVGGNMVKQQTYQIVNGQVIQPGLGFMATGCIIDNLGGQFVRFPDQSFWVPPYFYGASIPFVTRTQNPRIDTIPPPGMQVNSSGNPAVLRFVDDESIVMNPGALNSNLEAANALSQQFSLSAGGSLNTTTTNWANSILVDNPGGQWLNFPNQGITIEPWTSDAVIPLKTSTKSVVVNTTPPAGQVNTGVGNAATITFTDLQLPAAPGVPYGQNLSQATPQFIELTATGPSLANTVFNVTGAFGATGIVYRVTALSVRVLMASTTGFARQCKWLLGYGASAGNGTPIWAGGGGTGSGTSTTSPGSNATGQDMAFTAYNQPQFTGVNGNVLWIQVISSDGANFLANQILVEVALMIIGPVGL